MEAGEGVWEEAWLERRRGSGLHTEGRGSCRRHQPRKMSRMLTAYPRNWGGCWAHRLRRHGRCQGGGLPGGRGQEPGHGGGWGAPASGITEESRNPPEGFRKHMVGTQAESPGMFQRATGSPAWAGAP